MHPTPTPHYFDASSYHTPGKERLPFTERILLNNRLYFTVNYSAVVMRTRKEALRNLYDTKAWAASSFEIFRLIERTGGRFHITGMEHITQSSDPVLFISNHMSTLETMVFPAIIAPRREFTFVVKESLVKHPIFGAIMRSRNPVVVGRTDPRKDLEAVMNGGTELLSRGISIMIFPQRTRTVDFKPEEFNSIGVKLARKAGVAIVPVAIKTDFWGNGKWLKEFGPIDRHKPIHMRFGEPFRVAGNGKDENQKIIGFIQSSLQEWTNGL